MHFCGFAIHYFIFFPFYLGCNMSRSGKKLCTTAKCITKSETWAQDNKMQTVKQPNYGSFDGEPTECKVMFNTVFVCCILMKSTLCGMKLVLYSYACVRLQCLAVQPQHIVHKQYIFARKSICYASLGQLGACRIAHALPKNLREMLPTKTVISIVCLIVAQVQFSGAIDGAVREYQGRAL